MSHPDRLESIKPIPRREQGLFGREGEAGERLRAVLDAIDLTACESDDGWIRLVTVEGRRAGLEGEERNTAAAERWWARMCARLRRHGIEYITYAEHHGYRGSSQFGNARPQLWDSTAIRWTEEGHDRLVALTEALDKWLLSQDEAEEA